ncbi:A disintegrin and metalloproteinase with thrombospondin motifs 15 [Branchiostoma belcheri]|nr:A disintegrin and metalloproteinase with thrombospondin motifs 15 [Branchiostoma belcheri]
MSRQNVHVNGKPSRASYGRRYVMEEQCAKFDGQHFNINGLNRYTRWVPRYAGVSLKDSCKLTCRVAGTTMFYTLREKVVDGTPCGPDISGVCYISSYHGDSRLVVDGTPCGPDISGVCIQGRCQKTGCDNLLGSTAKRDKCGICGGRGESCSKVSGSYNKSLRVLQQGRYLYLYLYIISKEIFPCGEDSIKWASLYALVGYGYRTALEIPAGSTRIEIRQVSYNGKKVCNSLDLLAEWLERRSLKLVLGRSWVRSPARDQQGVLAKSAAPGMSNLEDSRTNLEKKRGSSVTVDGNYLAVRNAKGKYFINGGYVIRMAGVDELDIGGAVLSYSGSDTAEEKISIRDRTQEKLIIEVISSEEVPPQVIYSYLAPKASIQYTNQRETPRARTRMLPPPPTRPSPNAVRATWYTGSWGGCSKSCGHGEKRRSVQCMDQYGRQSGTCAAADRPAETARCYGSSTRCGEWIYGGWSECSKPCGRGVQLRLVGCRLQNGAIGPDRECDASSKPADTQECNTSPCSSRQCQGRYVLLTVQFTVSNTLRRVLKTCESTEESLHYISMKVHSCPVSSESGRYVLLTVQFTVPHTPHFPSVGDTPDIPDTVQGCALVYVTAHSPLLNEMFSCRVPVGRATLCVCSVRKGWGGGDKMIKQHAENSQFGTVAAIGPVRGNSLRRTESEPSGVFSVALATMYSCPAKCISVTFGTAAAHQSVPCEQLRTFWDSSGHWDCPSEQLHKRPAADQPSLSIACYDVPQSTDLVITPGGLGNVESYILLQFISLPLGVLPAG